MEDHHVDRPGVEAQQCVKLTGTNHSIGLIALGLMTRATKTERAHAGSGLIRRSHPLGGQLCKISVRLHGLVVIAGGKAPDSIPNSAVKILSADGTAS